MKKVDLIKMWQDRAYDGDKKYKQNELTFLLDTFLEALADAFEYRLSVDESVSLGNGVKLVVRHTPSRKYAKKTLKNIATGEPIEVPAMEKPAKNTIVLEGFEKEV